VVIDLLHAHHHGEMIDATDMTLGTVESTRSSPCADHEQSMGLKVDIKVNIYIATCPSLASLIAGTVSEHISTRKEDFNLP